MNLQDIKLAIIGPGYVGLPLTVEFGKQRPDLTLLTWVTCPTMRIGQGSALAMPWYIGQAQ